MNLILIIIIFNFRIHVHFLKIVVNENSKWNRCVHQETMRVLLVALIALLSISKMEGAPTFYVETPEGPQLVMEDDNDFMVIDDAGVLGADEQDVLAIAQDFAAQLDNLLNPDRLAFMCSYMNAKK